MCDLETSRMGAPYIYDISTLRVKQRTHVLSIKGPRKCRFQFIRTLVRVIAPGMISPYVQKRTQKFSHEPQEVLDTKTDSMNDASMSRIFSL